MPGTATFFVIRSGNTESVVTVDYVTKNGTAIAGVHYTEKSGTLIFDVDETVKSVIVVVADPEVNAPDRVFSLALSGASNDEEFSAVGTGLIEGNGTGTANGPIWADPDIEWGNGQNNGGGGFPVTFCFPVSDETTTITGGYDKFRWNMPHKMQLGSIRASLNSPSTSGSVLLDITSDGSSILNSYIELTAYATSVTIQAADLLKTSLSDNAPMSASIVQAGTGAKGLKVYLIGTQE